MPEIQPESKHTPYPELIDPDYGGPKDRKPYRFKAARRVHYATTNLYTKRMVLPLREGNHMLCRHELAHVKWSPRRMPKVSFDNNILLAVEEARMNLGLKRAKIQMRIINEMDAKGAGHGKIGKALAKSMGAQLTEAEQVMMLLSAIGTDSFFQIYNYLGGDEVKACKVANSAATKLRRGAWIRRRHVTSVKHMLKIAQWVAEQFDLDNEDTARQPQLAPGAACLATAGVGEETPGFSSRLPPWRGLMSMIPSGTHNVERVENANWGPMKVRRYEMPIMVNDISRNQTRKVMSSDEGSIIRSVHRLYIDGAIFRRTRKRDPGGSVLIDHSGSMRLSIEEVEAIVNACPGSVTIATYSGQSERGELRIVAEHGRRAERDAFSRYGSGNLVDGPALYWLAKQRQPRLWVSDGEVHGMHNADCQAILDDVKNVLARGNIKQIERPEEAVKHIQDTWRRG